MSIRAERKLQSQQCIMETVLALGYSGHNFSSISLRQLAREVGIVPSALYRYFQNKEALASALLDQVALVIKSDLGLMIDCFFNILRLYRNYRNFLLTSSNRLYIGIFLLLNAGAVFLYCKKKSNRKLRI